MGRFIKGIYAPLKHRLCVPSHFAICFRDLFGIYPELSGNIEHLSAAVAWLNRAQDVGNDDGVSYGYSFARGWLSSYPETTGYIIPTFLDYYGFTKDEEYLHRAIRMADWLASIQLENGAFQSGRVDAAITPSVFNTGQILLGLVRMYRQTGDDRYKKAAARAGDWLTDIQDEDGAWRKYSLNDIPHVYHTRVAWPLLELNSILPGTFLESAVRNINWALRSQLPNGWFRNNGFTSDQASSPILHTIVYAVRGILESARLLDNKHWLESATKPSEVLSRKLEEEETLAGAYDSEWRRAANYGCLKGDAQISVAWLRLFQTTRDDRFLSAAVKMSNYLKTLQNLTTRNSGINGAIKGPQPIWGKGMGFVYPNWATKFFVDALLLEEKIRGNMLVKENKPE